MANILLINVKQFYSGLPHQKKAVDFLGNLLANTPAKNILGLDNPNDWIKMSDAKLEWLQRQISDKTLNKFVEIWRDEKPKELIVDWYDMGSRVSEYFTVGEVTNHQPARIPSDTEIKSNVLKLAKELDVIREAWGGPIIVTSWYRPPAINKAVGGARYSQHLTGKAVDIFPVNGEGLMFERWLDKEMWTDKALGYGQKGGRGFTHLDLRPGRIRWNY